MSERPRPLKAVNRLLEGREPWQIVAMTAASVLGLVWAHRLLTGRENCTDGADEAGAGVCGACAAAQWACSHSRRCIPAAWRCDGAPDCGPGDTSDERHCPTAGACPDAMFRCDSGACVPWEYVCDSRADCADAADERVCPPPADRVLPEGGAADRSLCEPHEFQCDNGECIRQEFRCDAHVDCLDGSDESCNVTVAPLPASSTAAPALLCDGGRRCVPLRQQCDGSTDCADGADEAGRCDEPQCALSPCSHRCVPTPAGPVCECPPAMQVAASIHGFLKKRSTDSNLDLKFNDFIAQQLDKGQASLVLCKNRSDT